MFCYNYQKEKLTKSIALQLKGKTRSKGFVYVVVVVSLNSPFLIFFSSDHQTSLTVTKQTRSHLFLLPQQIGDTNNGAEREWEGTGSGHRRTHKPDGHTSPQRSVPIHHGLRLLESWQTKRTIRVSKQTLLLLLLLSLRM